MKLDISYKYTKPYAENIGTTAALREAIQYKNDPNYPYMNDLATIVLNKKDYLAAGFWVSFLNTYIVEMYSVISNVNNYPSIDSYYLGLIKFMGNTDYDYSNIFKIVLSSNSPIAYAELLYNSNNNTISLNKEEILLIKSKIIELGAVENVIDLITFKPNSKNYEIEFENFYQNVPNEYKLGVIL